MDDLVKLLLEKMGVPGAIIVALAGYAIKKEVYFQKERAEFITLLESKSNALLSIVKEAISSNVALEKEVRSLRMELGRMERDSLRQPGQERSAITPDGAWTRR